MAHDQEGSSTEAVSVASSSPAACWWPETISCTNSSSILMDNSSSAGWNAMINDGRYGQQQQQKQVLRDQQHNSVGILTEDISSNSFTYQSNHEGNNGSGGNHGGNQSTSAGSGDSSHLWNNLLLGAGNGEGMQQVSSQKSFIRSTLMFDPACDYLKTRPDGGWEFMSNPSGLTTLEKQLIRGGYNDDDGTECRDDHHSESRLMRRSKLTDLVSNWSIAPPNPHLHFDPNSASPDHNIIKHEAANGLLSFPFHSYGDHHDDNDDVLLHRGQQLINESGGLISTFAAGLANQIGPVIGLKNRGLMAETTPCTTSSINSLPRNLSVDLISFSPALMDLTSSSCDLGINNNAGHHHPASSSSRKGGGGRGSGAAAGTDGKKKRSSTDNHCTSETLFKKPKHDTTSTTTTTTTTTSPPTIKSQQLVPKVKVGDKITALQQIVSPFGKTDTASVLLEAIKYIRFLQEQVQLLSDPYLKSNANKDHISWPGSMERKEKADTKQDLRGRGLCLVPISCTPQAYKENSGPDYWTPPFRGCLYR